MEDYRELEQCERGLCGAVPDEPRIGLKLAFAALVVAAPWLLVATVGGLALLFACVAVAG